MKRKVPELNKAARALRTNGKKKKHSSRQKAKGPERPVSIGNYPESQLNSSGGQKGREQLT